ncbi:MAG: hypothetical protein DHS20C18_35140 [Saprospiraceae bacterium]|nr:MAG: hypothetical protein DHS20C18_35140 [Saprospiraceae bacterium]
MIEIRTLEGVSPEQLADTFNRAFTGYFVPIQMTEALVRDKMLSEQTRLAYSAGAFYGSQLVGMLLQGKGHYDGADCAYNGGTGVFPEFRGQNLTARMYEFLLPRLQESGVQKCLLEVITENAQAIHVYQKIGFKINRQFDCFRGLVNAPKQAISSAYYVRVNPHELPWHIFSNFGNALPSWPYTLEAAQRILHLLSSVTIYQENECIAFGLINKSTGRIFQFGVHPDHRRKGIGYHLFHQLSQLTTRGLSILNIDSTDQATILFLRHIGFEKYIGQYEMQWEL